MRVRALIQGIVQGVGFRPFVYNLAGEHRLAGQVANDGRGVILELEGDEAAVEAFFAELIARKPPLAHIVCVEREEIEPRGETEFRIAPSRGEARKRTLISPDTCVCEDCLAELTDPADRRFGYPFINCTNCGPRYTIIKGIPYDRPLTTMAAFTMCPACQAEYENPADRRFHAQPNACPACGPQVRLTDPAGNAVETAEPIAAAAEALAEGKIVAVKGLGGFHLAVDAASETAVDRLRRKKHREEKPLAVMVGDLDAARRLVVLSRPDEELLVSSVRPIVLAPKRPGHGLAEAVSPGGKYFGVMLPYTPLHFLLLAAFTRRRAGGALVMTSGNISEEPMAITDEDALSRLGPIADLFLLHDRDIFARADDSVAMSVLGLPRVIRRARGYVPRPVFLDRDGPSVLAVGPELKNTVCLTRDNEAFISGHIGDLENLETLKAFEATIDHLESILEIEPEAVALDLHPDYLSTQYAEKIEGPPLIRVQHHAAHILSAAAELGLDLDKGAVVGLALDGTGYGPSVDGGGTIWGGEILAVNKTGFTRLGHLSPFRLPGGSQAIKEPWRTGLGLLHLAFGEEWPEHLVGFTRRAEGRIELLGQMMDRGVGSPLTSSVGRLFDGLAALCGLKDRAAYEGQAAIELEAALDPAEQGAYSVEIVTQEDGFVLDPRPLIHRAAAEAGRGAPAGVISARFHRGLSRALAEAAQRAAAEAGTKTVVLSGGCFMNAWLLTDLVGRLEVRGLEAAVHRDVPTNDGGVSLGQALAARLALEAGDLEMWTRPKDL